MSYQVAALFLGLVGSLAVLALSINAFFLRGIFIDLNAVKVQIAKIFGMNLNNETKINKNEKDIETLFNLMEEVKNKHHHLRTICVTQDEMKHHIERAKQ